MKPDITSVVVTGGQTAGAAEVHHREFPEIRADGENARDAAAHLALQLTRALDSALTPWRRDSLLTAIADVEAFVQVQ